MTSSSSFGGPASQASLDWPTSPLRPAAPRRWGALVEWLLTSSLSASLTLVAAAMLIVFVP